MHISLKYKHYNINCNIGLSNELNGVEVFFRSLRSLSVIQEIPPAPRPLWYLNFHYHVLKSPQQVLILNKLKSVRTLYPTSLSSFLILFSHLRLGLPSGLFLSGFRNKSFMNFSPLS